MASCPTSFDAQAEQFRVTGSFRDNLKFNAYMISAPAMDEVLRSVEETPQPAKKHGNWGWWSLVAPFIL